MSKTIELEKVNEIIDEEIHRIESVQLTDEHEDTICILLDIKQKLQPTPSDHFDRVYREEDLNEVFYSVSVEEDYTSEWYKEHVTTKNEKKLIGTLLKVGQLCSTEKGAERLLKAHQNLAKIQAFARELNRKSGYVVDFKMSNMTSVILNFDENYLAKLYCGYIDDDLMSNIDVYVKTHGDFCEIKEYVQNTLKLTQRELEDIMYL